MFENKKFIKYCKSKIEFCLWFAREHPIEEKLKLLLEIDKKFNIENLLQKSVFISQDAIEHEDRFFPYEILPAYSVIGCIHSTYNVFRLNKKISLNDVLNNFESIYDMCTDKRIKKAEILATELKFEEISEQFHWTVNIALKDFGMEIFLSKEYRKKLNYKLNEFSEKIRKEEIACEWQRLLSDGEQFNIFIEKNLSNQIILGRLSINESFKNRIDYLKKEYKKEIIEECKNNPVFLKNLIYAPNRIFNPLIIL